MVKLKRSECSILHLVLKRKWFEMIERGEKRQEYRVSKPYWVTRLSNWDDDGRKCVVEFRLGYGHDAPRMAFESPFYVHVCESSHPGWGEPSGPHYLIALGARVELKD